MKKSLLVLFSIFCLVNVKAQTNIYHPFPDSSAFWQYQHVNYLYPPYYRDQTRYGLDGDTTIKGNIYHKVYSLFDSTIATPAPNFHNTYYAGIRETAKKVYAIISPDTIEHLLYDFSLAIGDTIHYNCYGIFSRVLSSIDSVLLLDGKYRKRYNFNGVGAGTGQDVIIEGMGSDIGFGLFQPFVQGQCTCADGYEFTCFKQNDTARYVDNPLCNRCFCTFLTTVNEIEKQYISNISPNPFSSQTTLQFDKNISEATLQIYNVVGQQVKQIKNVSGQIITIQRANLPSGLYFVNIMQENKIVSSNKLIITD